MEHHTIDLFDKKSVVTPPFKNPNSLYNEVCFLYVLDGMNHSYSEEEMIKVEKGEGLFMKCGNYDTQPDPEIS